MQGKKIISQKVKQLLLAIGLFRLVTKSWPRGALLVVSLVSTLYYFSGVERAVAFGQSKRLFGNTSLVIKTRTNLHEFSMEVAETPAQQAIGLMGRQSLAENTGMLFVYARPQLVAMWMKNTYLPLDMLFIGPNGIINRVVKRTTPMSLRRIRSLRPVAAVIEVNAGTVDRLFIKVGDRIIHENFNNSD